MCAYSRFAQWGGGGGVYVKQEAMNEVNAGRDRATFSHGLCTFLSKKFPASFRPTSSLARSLLLSLSPSPLPFSHLQI